MNPILRNVLAVIAGGVVGMIVNMGIIMMSHSLIPLPEGVNPGDMESLNAGMHLMEAKHFLMPFLAHALGTLAGAFTAVKIAASHHLKIGLIIGGFFIIGGIMAAQMLSGAPMWFKVLDLVGAYFPMGWLGWKLAGGQIRVE